MNMNTGIIMKKNVLFRLLSAAACILMSAGCATTTDKINSLVDEAVENSGNLTPEEWAQRDSLLEEYLLEYESDQESYTPEEQEAIDKALGRYYGAQMREGIEQTKRGVLEFMERLPGFIDGFMEGVGMPLDSLQ